MLQMKQGQTDSRIRKNMAGLHFTPIHYKPNQPIEHIRDYVFAKFLHVLTTLFMLGLKMLELSFAFL